jgi:hypothetical protein
MKFYMFGILILIFSISCGDKEERKFKIPQIDEPILLTLHKDTVISLSKDTVFDIKLITRGIIEVKEEVNERLIYKKFYKINEELKTDSIISINAENLSFKVKIINYYEVIETTDTSH